MLLWQTTFSSVTLTKKTPEEQKPFIARKDALSGFTKGADLKTQSSGGDYTVGDRVKHIKFGAGTVLSIEPADNDRTREKATSVAKILLTFTNFSSTILTQYVNFVYNFLETFPIFFVIFRLVPDSLAEILKIREPFVHCTVSETGHLVFL